MSRIMIAGFYIAFGLMFNCYAQDSNNLQQFNEIDQSQENMQSVVELIDDNACEKFPNETDFEKRTKLERDCEKLKQAKQ